MDGPCEVSENTDAEVVMSERSDINPRILSVCFGPTAYVKVSDLSVVQASEVR